MKEKGILLPIYSLPSKYGIGDFGNEAYEFIDILSENNIKYWNILPINACNRAPYSPLSYYALEEDYISIDKLIEHKLIKSAETREIKDRVEYDDYKEKYYREAFSRFRKNEEYEEFIKCPEINEYVEYVCDSKDVSKEYCLFLQYILYRQWMELKQYANSKGVKIIGDMPAYPVFNSAETNYHSECFDMEDGVFKYEAGAPPDAFNEDGQTWGNPVYNVENLRKDNFKYLVNRYKYYLNLFDKIRVDYFRGYDSFFKVPLGKSAKEGIYCDGVSYPFFDELLKVVNKDGLIVEDLGDIRQETINLREHYGFTRQKLFQFTFDFERCEDRDNDTENVVMFPANHDCPTMRGWYNELKPEDKEKITNFLKNKGCSEDINLGIIQYSKKCRADIVILAVQDILGLDNSARMNFPGTISQDNWSWKLTDFELFKEKIKEF